MTDWTIMMALLLIGCLTDYVSSKYIKRDKVRRLTVLSIWLAIGTAFLILWMVR